MNPIKWLLKKLRLLRTKPEAPISNKTVEYTNYEFNNQRYLTPRYIPAPRRRNYPQKIRGKFKPRTAHEKRLWKPNAKLED